MNDEKILLKKIQNECQNKLFINDLFEFSLELNKKNIKINSYKEYNFFDNRKMLNNFLNNLLSNIEKLLTVKNYEIVENIINSNYFILCELLPNEYKFDKNILNQITLIFNKKNIHQKYKILEQLFAIKNNPDFSVLEKKIEYPKIFLNDKYNIDNILKQLSVHQNFIIVNELNNKNKKQQTIYLRNISFKVEKIKNAPIYNKEYYDFIDDRKLSNNKIDIIKYAYFQNGINLNELKKDLGNELYTCDSEQLQNYVDCYTKYLDGYLNKNEYEFSKNLIEDYSLPQKELAKDVLPIIENFNLTQKEIRECIDIGKNRNSGDTSKFLKFAIIAKENNYSDREIMILLKDSKEKPTYNIELKTEMIKEFDNSEITTILNLNKLQNKDMELILNDKNLVF